ncbi:MAG: peptide chain release factor N(5)-glutamine methyltransferase [Flavobacteriales bacterium]|nr:peptide chain release factor N(5)-glutamine methyltransferase [Flavobacteriales bacterium]
MHSNTVRAFKQYFFEHLKAIYEEGEVNQLFSLTFFYYKNWDKISLRFNEQEKLSESELLELRTIVKRLANAEPIQHIFETAYFYGLDFKVSKDVLVPRQETEELVDLILNHIPNGPISILDIGTGSGCIPIAIAKNAPEAKVLALDVSSEALSIAEENASIHQVELKLFQEDVLKLDSITSIIPEKINVIISNPPYITVKEKALMHPNVLEFDPHLALFVTNEKPLVFYEKIVQLAEEKLESEGQLYFEINEHFGEETKALIEQYQFKKVSLIKDINEKDRMVSAIKK